MALALTENGLSTESVDEIRAGLDADFKTVFGPQINTTDAGVIGQVNGILSERLGLLQEGLQAVVSSQDPDAAVGAMLAALCALTGTTPLSAKKSTATLTLTGDDATLVPEGSVAAVTVTEIPFATVADGTLALLTPWAGTTVYAIGDRVSNDGNAYVTTNPGTSAGSGGPTGTATTPITDGGVEWRFMGAGLAAVDVAAEASDTGPTIATSGSITEIVTAVSGWSGVINLSDAIPGRNVEADEDLRVRREEELQTPGTGPQKAIRSDLKARTDLGITSVRVFMNVTDITDADGVPPHSVEALVSYPTAPDAEIDQEIFDQLLASVAGGIRTHGDVVGASVDDEGVSQVMKFSRPTEVPIYVIITLTFDVDLYPADGDEAVKAAIVAFRNLKTTGDDAVASSTSAQAFKIAGVNDVVSCFIGTSPSPASSATIAIALRELAVFDTSRITVNSSAATP